MVVFRSFLEMRRRNTTFQRLDVWSTEVKVKEKLNIVTLRRHDVSATPAS